MDSRKARNRLERLATFAGFGLAAVLMAAGVALALNSRTDETATPAPPPLPVLFDAATATPSPTALPTAVPTALPSPPPTPVAATPLPPTPIQAPPAPSIQPTLGANAPARPPATTVPVSLPAPNGVCAPGLSEEALIKAGAQAFGAFPTGVPVGGVALYQLTGADGIPHLYTRGANGCFTSPDSVVISLCVDGSVSLEAGAACAQHGGIARRIP